MQGVGLLIFIFVCAACGTRLRLKSSSYMRSFLCLSLYLMHDIQHTQLYFVRGRTHAQLFICGLQLNMFCLVVCILGFIFVHISLHCAAVYVCLVIRMRSFKCAG